MDENQLSDKLSDSGILLQLTAYLDGELPSDETRVVEDRLATDEKYRLLMQQLQRTWDVLDILPSAAAASSFTQSTMKLVVEDARKLTAKHRQSFWTWPLRILALILVPAVAYAGTFFTSRSFQNRPNQQLVRDLPVVKDFDVYNCDPSITIEFLELLAQEKNIFGNIQPTPADEHYVSYQKPAPNLSALNEFNGREKNRIRINNVNFQNLNPESKVRIRKLRADIEQHENSAELKTALYGYFHWLSTLGETDTTIVKDTTEPPERIAIIRSIVDERVLPTFASQLPKNDLKSVYLALIELALRRGDLIRESYLQLFGVEANAELELRARNLGSADQMIYVAGGQLKEIYNSYPEKIEEIIAPEDIDQIVQKLLSEEAQLVFYFAKDFQFESVVSEAHLLASWMVFAYENRFSPQPMDLFDFYDSMPSDVKDSLDNEYPDDKKRRLRQMWEAEFG